MIQQARFGVGLALLPGFTDFRKVVRSPRLKGLPRLRLLLAGLHAQGGISALDGGRRAHTPRIETDHVVAGQQLLRETLLRPLNQTDAGAARPARIDKQRTPRLTIRRPLLHSNLDRCAVRVVVIHRHRHRRARELALLLGPVHAPGVTTRIPRHLLVIERLQPLRYCRAIPRVIRSRGMRAGSLRRGIGGQSRHHRPRQQRTPHQGSSQGPFPPPTGMSRTRISFPHCHWFPFSFSRLDDLLAGSPSCLGVVTIPEPDARIAPGRTHHGPLIPWA